MIIAIDGPAGAGKSTIAKLIAKQLGLVYIDTGAMYRAVGLKAKRNNIACSEQKKIEEMLKNTEVELKNENGATAVYLDGENVSTEIRLPEISRMASDISAVPVVRYAMVEMQRSMANKTDTILDGRDIGTFVLPNADVKIFLTASVEERAERRYKELIARGENVKREDVRSDIEKRDYNDSHRALAPLKKADDATEVDTTGMTIDQVCEKIISLVRNK
ncbi:MAG: (d)CMP kinase [Firmicutes bacterium]|nr:(d)CMP kinase [Bacillota bacterium]